MIADPINALADLLKADPSVASLVATRVYGGELPDSQNVSMPRECVQLTHAGGPADPFGYIQVGRLRVDVRCWGPTPYRAGLVHREVHGALKGMRRNVQGDTMLFSATVDTAPTSLRDPDTEWPFMFSSWMVLYSERLVVV